MVTNGASVVNQINSYKTVFPKVSVGGGSQKIIEFSLGRASWLNKTSVIISVLQVKGGIVLDSVLHVVGSRCGRRCPDDHHPSPISKN